MTNIFENKKVKKIINMLLKGEQSLTGIAKAINISKPTALKYLNTLENIGLIHSKINKTKIGREKKYKLGTFSTFFSLDFDRGVISFTNKDYLNIHNVLVGQIGQKQFRNAVDTYLAEILKQLKLDFSCIIFGSVARGEATAKSDIDILLISERKWDRKNKDNVMKALYKGVVKSQIQAKPMFLTLSAFIEKKGRLIQMIKNEGLIVYDQLKSDQLWKAMKRYWNIPD
jgi:predicted nucleotidyltransferase